MLTPQQLAREVQSGKFRPAYYLFGTEDYRIVEAEKFLARQFLPDRQRLANCRRINARRTACADLMAELSNLPMLGERQFFGVSEFQSLKPTEVDRVLKLLSPPDPNRMVVFSSPSARMPRKTSAFLKKVARAAEPVRFVRLTVNEMKARIQRGLAAANLEIESEAARLLTDLIAGNAGAVESELAKLIDFKEPGGTITREDIQAVTAGYEVYDIFKLSDLIISRNRLKALKMVQALLAEGNSPVAICNLMLQHFLSLYLVKNGHPPLGRRGHLVALFRRQASGYDNRVLERIVVALADTDAALRGGVLEPHLAVELLVLRLLGES